MVQLLKQDIQCLQQTSVNSHENIVAHSLSMMLWMPLSSEIHSGIISLISARQASQVLGQASE